MHEAKLYLIALVVALVAFAGTCEPKPDPIIPTDTADCNAACENLRALGCEEGEPLADGTPCEIFCAETQGNGFPLRPSCVKSIKACGEIDTCVGQE